MADMMKTYKGYEIWHYKPGEKTPYEFYEARATGNRPKITGSYKKYGAVKKKIDEVLNAKPEKVKTYKGVDIVYHPKRKRQYYAKVGRSGKYNSTIEDAESFIEKELYKASPEHKAKKARKKKEREEQIRRAQEEGIGTDEDGNPIMPSR